MKFFPPLALRGDDTLVTRLTEIFRDIAAAFTDLVATGVAKINRLDDVPNEQYDLYTNTAAIKQHIHGTLASTVTLNNFVYSVRPTLTLSGTGTFRAYDFDVTIAGSGASTAAYGLIGAMTLHGAGSTKAVYGRSVGAASCTGTVVGTVSGAQYADGSVANAWAQQIDVTGPNNSTLPTALAVGTYVGSNTGGGGICHFAHFVSNQLTINNSVYRWNKANNTGSYLEVLNADGVTFDYRVDSLGRLSNSKGLTLVGNGYPLFVASALESNKSATVSATTIFTATADGMHRVPIGVTVRTAATTSSSVTATVKATDPRDSVVKTYQLGSYSGNVANEGASFIGYVYAKTGTAVQYVLTYASSGATSMVYDAIVGCEYMG